MIINITDDNFENEVLKSDKLTLVDFYAKWCNPCKMLSPIVEKYADTTDIRVCKADVDTAGRTAAMLGIMSIPTLMLFKEGKSVSKQIGLINENELKEFVDAQR